MWGRGLWSGERTACGLARLVHDAAVLPGPENRRFGMLSAYGCAPIHKRHANPNYCGT
jgi:hypothetical protein